MPETAILLSTYDRHLRSDGLFSRSGMENTAGLTALLCDAGRSVEIACEHTLAGRYDAYKCIVIPELHYGLAPETVSALLAYAENGGSLLLVGKNTAAVFAAAGVPLTVSDTAAEAWRWVSCAGFETAMQGVCSIGAPQMESTAFVGNEERSIHATAAAILPWGAGKIGVIACNLGAQYQACAQFTHRTLALSVCDKLYTPAVSVAAAVGLLEIVMTEKNGRRFVQLINANGSHANRASAAENFIPPVVDVRLALADGLRPSRAVRYPSGTEVALTEENGVLYAEIGRVDLHEVLELID